MSVIRRMMGMVGGAPAANAGIDGQTFSDSRFAPTFAEVAVLFRTNGRIDKITTLGGTTDSGFDWYLPNDTNAGTLYWIRLTVVSGDTPTSTIPGTWYQLSSDRQATISWSSTFAGASTCSAKFEIATDSGGVNIVGTGTMTLTAESS